VRDVRHVLRIREGPRILVRAADRVPGALYVVAITFFLLAVYIIWEAVDSLITREEPLASPVGIILVVLSLAVIARGWRVRGSRLVVG
jgi:hypothetical protein